MMMFPVESSDHSRDVLIIVLEEENIDRMRVADPATIEIPSERFNLVNPMVLVCLEKVGPKLMSVINSGDIEEIAKYLTRGYKFDSSKGDGKPPRSIFSDN